MSGTGFPTDQTVTLELYPGRTGGTVAAGPREPTIRSDGTFTDRDLKVPNDAEPGPYRVVTTVPGHDVDDVPITLPDMGGRRVASSIRFG